MTAGPGVDVTRVLRAAAVLDDEADRLVRLAARIASRAGGVDWSGPARTGHDAVVTSLVAELRLVADVVSRTGDAATVAAHGSPWSRPWPDAGAAER